MLSLPFLKKNLGAPLQSRKAMLETLVRHLDMVRLSAGAILMIAAAGCTGLIDGGSDGKSNQQRDAETRWEQDAYPALTAGCAGCHNGSRANVGFLVGTDQASVKTQLLAYTPSVINFDAPGSSRVLSKGVHEGPELTLTQSSAVLQWIQAEKEAIDHDPLHPAAVYKVDAFTPTLCTAGAPDNAEGTCPTNHISLASVATIGPMLPGAEISFTAQGLSSLYITNLKLVGGTAGAYLEHPLFVSKPAMGAPYPDQIDRFFALKENVAASANDVLAGGTHSFAGFVPTDPVEIHFKIVSAYKPDAGGKPVDTGACKVIGKFTTATAPATVSPAALLQTNCANCHTAGNAKAAMDLTGVTSADPAAVAIACAQVKSRINLTTTDQSGFYLAPDPASGSTHPFHFATPAAFTSFKTPVDTWVQAEKTAP